MSALPPNWTGRIYGTNTGNFFMELTESEEKIISKLSINDDRYGLFIYDLTGNYKNSTLKLTGQLSKNKEQSDSITIEIEGNIDTEHLQGKWALSNGLTGLLQASPGKNLSKNSNFEKTTPLQLHSKNIPVGAIRLDEKDLEKLISEVKKDFTNGKVTIAYHTRLLSKPAIM